MNENECEECRKSPVHVLSYIQNKLHHFCSVSCREAFEKKQETPDAQPKESVLRRVRVFIARKTPEGIAVVRSQGSVQGGSDPK